ncbi:uncharacterized protein BCR38DRAFT_80158 [Pseudomassariella vexata]|uniref:Myb-like domain-containing protein n=1 Tax=Pseudomassariella vexata TaxID=1141098 RepID=A0A1Y2DER2_9PEZI|nr:uncharacterized protein BCR38DRAFT_80158 [Pseudomassariella vexata]ORY57773.1 hypothetical protein BCR38DRAFT_80158 [Pseudomassariella vexata]
MNMPKHNRQSSTHNRYSNPMPVSLAPSAPINVGYNTRPQLPLNTGFYPTIPSSSQAQASMQQQSYDPYQTVVPPPMPHRPSSGAWSPQDDNSLLQARQQGLNWAQIQSNYFPNKTPNACRKRHERLMERKGADDWDAQKLERIAKEYMSMRKEIWQPLASRVGEKWSVVEQKCMNNGLKNLQSAARSGARRDRLESGQPLSHGYDDDSGISGIGLTPVDDLDASYSSPETTTSSSHSGSNYSGIHPMQLNHHQAYGHNYNTSTGGLSSSGYSSSVSSTAAQAQYGNMQSHSHHSQNGSPYMGHGQRLPSVDMGIDAIINRPAHHGGAPSSI